MSVSRVTADFTNVNIAKNLLPKVYLGDGTEEEIELVDFDTPMYNAVLENLKG